MRPRGAGLFLGVASGALAAWLWPGTVPGGHWWLAALILAPLVRTRLALPALALAAAGISLTAIQHGQAQRLDAVDAGVERSLTGRVATLPARHPERLEFLFDPRQAANVAFAVPPRVRVRWYDAPPNVMAGEVWTIPLRLQPPRGRVNFVGHDAERHYFAHGIGALGVVGKGAAVRHHEQEKPSLAGWRDRIRQRMSTLLAEEPARAEVVALALADRSLMPFAHRDLFAATGTGHLLAISGLHIGFAALVGHRLGWLAVLALGLTARIRAGRVVCWCSALAVATAYAALAGFGVSTRRALIMLLAVAVTALSRRNMGPFTAWAMALAIVLLAEPAAALSAGFWLSFGAVLLLILSFAPRTRRLDAVRTAIVAQFTLFAGLLPMGMFWFQQASLQGLVANLFAIPAVSLVLVPLILLGTLLLAMGQPAYAAVLLRPASWAGSGLTDALGRLADAGEAFRLSTPEPPVVAAVLASFGLVALLGPPARRLRLLGFSIAVSALSMSDQKPPAGTIRVELLDVGQGLSALLSTHQELTVYDTGPGEPGAWDLATGVIQPAIRQSGHEQPDRIIVSHGDLDHAGGLATLRQTYPATPVWANTGRPETRTPACLEGLSWRDATLRAKALHPTPFLPYLGNLSSCVLNITGAGHSVLLPGDIDIAVEQRLVSNGLGRHDVLLAPHHGSRTSSGAALLHAVRPALVLVPAGAGNRFGFPHPDVLARYRASGARTLSVSDCGALRLDLRPDGSAWLQSARKARPAPWRWPAGDACP